MAAKGEAHGASVTRRKNMSHQGPCWHNNQQQQHQPQPQQQQHQPQQLQQQPLSELQDQFTWGNFLGYNKDGGHYICLERPCQSSRSSPL